jgi:transposase
VIRIPLPLTEAARLEALFRATDDRKLRDRLLLYVFAVVNLVSAAARANTLGSPKDAKKRTGQGKTRRLREAFAAPLRHVGRAYPRGKHPRVVLVIDNAPWHRGRPIDAVLRDNPHLEFKRLPSYSPQLNPVERLWEKRRRRATHNRLFDTLAELKASIRASLGDFQTVRHKVMSILQGRPRRKAAK